MRQMKFKKYNTCFKMTRIKLVSYIIYCFTLYQRKRQENVNDSIFVNLFITVYVENRKRQKCLLAQSSEDAIEVEIGMVKKSRCMDTVPFSWLQYCLICVPALSFMQVSFLCGMMCKPGLTGLHGSYAPGCMHIYVYILSMRLSWLP